MRRRFITSKRCTQSCLDPLSLPLQPPRLHHLVSIVNAGFCRNSRRIGRHCCNSTGYPYCSTTQPALHMKCHPCNTNTTLNKICHPLGLPTSCLPLASAKSKFKRGKSRDGVGRATKEIERNACLCQHSCTATTGPGPRKGLGEGFEIRLGGPRAIWVTIASRDAASLAKSNDVCLPAAHGSGVPGRSPGVPFR